MAKRLQKETLQFLKDLKNNNNREWFNDNKNKYLAANEDFISFVSDLIKEIAKFDPSVALLEAKSCVFRIYKDVRFSKDKLPYKTNFGAAISPRGKGNGFANYYFHLSPEGCFLAGGAYMVEPADLKAIRQEISYNGHDFLKIIQNKKFLEYFKLDGEKLVNVPRGFDKEDPMGEYLKYKQFVIYHALDEKEIFSENFIISCGKVFKAMVPFNDFLNAPMMDK